MKNKLISEVGERNLIHLLLEKRDKSLKTDDEMIKSSYHDDAALLENKSKYMVISTDMLFQHSHFPKQMTYYQMGAKAVTVNVSDILAMNATPDSILMSMGLPPEMKIEDYEELTDGILDKCNEYDITLVGGDINENSEIVLCGTGIGFADDTVKLQKEIKKGDLIAVTGKLGGPAAGLDLLKDNYTEESSDIINTLLSPTIPVKESEVLRKYPEIITSMTDITDGLAVELGHLLEKNEEIGFEIYYDKLPYDNQIVSVAKKNGKDVLEYLLHFGEEFELLLTLDSDKYYENKDKLNFLNIIGETTDTARIILIKDDEEKVIPVFGYEHLKDD